MITPPGRGGIAALRLAGEDSLKILNKLFEPDSAKRSLVPFLMRKGSILDESGDKVDEVMTVLMPAGKSYTGEEQVEIYCHGGSRVVQKILELIIRSGARVAEPGEFTKLAFLNGKIDLARAEAISEIINASTERSLKASQDHLLGAYTEHIGMLRKSIVDFSADIETLIDFSEEDISPVKQSSLTNRLVEITRAVRKLKESYRSGRIINEGFKIAIAGKPNVGKSSLFNLLLKQERALVNPIAGTTRDYLTEWIDMEGFMVSLTDTAGLRKGGSSVEKLGILRAQKILKEADLLLWMIDLSSRNWKKHARTVVSDNSDQRLLLIGNKVDLTKSSDKNDLTIKDTSDCLMFPISCKTRKGLSSLRKEILSRINQSIPDLTSGHIVTSARHHSKLSEAELALKRSAKQLKSSFSPEIVAFELKCAVNSLDEITGKIYTEDILGSIFSRFCIGK